MKGKFKTTLIATVLVIALIVSDMSGFALASTSEIQTKTWDFSKEEQLNDFTIYHSSTATFEIKEEQLAPTDNSGELKAILEASEREYHSVSVDIYPESDGTINSGLYLGGSDVNNDADGIDALAILVQSDFVATDEWADAPNRVDLIVAAFPVWTEYHRTVSETGAGNALFIDGEKQPLNLKVIINENKLDITLSLKSEPSKCIHDVYTHNEEYKFENGYVGIRSNASTNRFDNFEITYSECSTVDKSELEELVTYYHDLENIGYVSDMWTAFQSSLEQADEVLSDTNATYKEVYKAKNLLLDAIDALVIEKNYIFEQNDNFNDFSLYTSGVNSFEIDTNIGRLKPSGSDGEMKAILQGDDRLYKSVSVDIYPGEGGTINGGIYLGASDVSATQDSIDALAILVQSDFVATETWADAPNRVDLIVASFPVWTEYHRTVSETGAGNALYTDGNKEGLNLKADIEGKKIAIRLSRIDNPDIYIETVYEYTGEYNLENGWVGIRSAHNDNTFDNFSLQYKLIPDKTELKTIVSKVKQLDSNMYTAESWSELMDLLEKAETMIDNDNATDSMISTMFHALTEEVKGLSRREATYTFGAMEELEEFSLYHSGQDTFSVANGALQPSGAAGELKAILEADKRIYSSVSVDIYPGENGTLNGGLYIGAKKASNAADSINGLSVYVQSDLVETDENPDAANRIDLVIGSFPKWKELHRTITETSAGNALFTDGKREGVNLKVDIDANRLTIRLSLISNPLEFIKVTYEYTGNYNLETRYVGIRSANSDNYFDNMNIEYERKSTYMFNDSSELEDFTIYSSTEDSYAVKDGQLVSTGNTGEIKAILEKEGREYQSVSVDIYPGEDGIINGGLYLGASGATDTTDKIDALAVLVQSDFEATDEWTDAPNRIDLIIGSFPTWKEHQRIVSETGAGNALFTDGVKQPLNLRVDMNGYTLAITLSLLSDSTQFIQNVYEYDGTYDLGKGYVGIRSNKSMNCFDNLDLTYEYVKPDEFINASSDEPWKSITRKLFHLYSSEGQKFQINDEGEFIRDVSGYKLAEYKEKISGNFAASVDITAIQRKTNATVLVRASNAKQIQNNTTNPGDAVTGFGLYVEGNNDTNNPNRLDVYMCKFVDGNFAGYIVPEEYAVDRYVNEGEDAILTGAGDDYCVTLNFEVVGNKVKARVYRTDNPEQATAIVTFDLTKTSTTNESTVLSGDSLMLRSNLFEEGTVFQNFVYYGTNQDFGFFDESYRTDGNGQSIFVKEDDTYYADGKGYKRFTDTSITLPENYQVESVLTLGENGVTKSGLILNTTDYGNGVDNFAGYSVSVEKEESYEANRIDIALHYNNFQDGTCAWLGQMGRLVDEGTDTLMASMPTDGKAIKIRLVILVKDGVLEVYAENYYNSSERTDTLRVDLNTDTAKYPLLSGGNLSMYSAGWNEQTVIFEELSLLDLDKKAEVDNAGFEDSDSDIESIGYIGNTDIAYITSDAAHMGDYSLFVSANTGTMYLPIEVKANKDYVLRFFSKSEQNGKSSRVGITDGTTDAATVLVGDFAISSSTDWESNVASFNSGNNTVIYLKISGGTGISYLDDITVAVPMDASVTSSSEGEVTCFNQYNQASTDKNFVFLYGDTVTIVAVPDKVYDFGGWFDGTFFAGKKAVKTICIKEDITLQAVYMFDGMGDLDDSDWIENIDLKMMRKVLVGSQQDDYDSKAADLNTDEKINVLDLVALKKREADIDVLDNEVIATAYLQDGAVYQITDTNSGEVLQASSYSLTESEKVVTGTNDGELVQLWKAIQQDDGTYMFKNMAIENRYLTVGGGVYFDESPGVVFAESGNNNAQRWIVRTTDEEGMYQIVSKLTGKSLNVDGVTGQAWNFTVVSDGTEETPILLSVSGYTEHSSTPEIIKENDTYYMFVMQPGIRMKKSTDLTHWEDAGWAFEDGKNPQWITEEYGDDYYIFAPSITKMGNTYFLYYSVSYSGAQTSAIAVATSQTLDPGTFVDQGIVLYSTNDDDYNCIDPYLYVEEEKGYLVFGSWYEGVAVIEVDYETGMISGNDGKTALSSVKDNITKLASSKTGNGVEAGYLIKKGNYYYLFTAKGTYEGNEDQYYNIVSRSTSITGTFKDANGNSMTSWIAAELLGWAGTTVSESKDGITKPAHASIFRDDDGKDYFVTEYLNTDMPSQLAISTIVWSDAEDTNGDGDYGWPTTALTPNVLD